MTRTRKRIAIVVGVCVGLLALNYAPVAWGSMFGEENLTLVQILAQMTQTTSTLKDISSTAGQIADDTQRLTRMYRQINAGVDELRNYSFDQFLYDMKGDFYNQYPGFGKLEYASKNLERWSDTRTRSPFTAYQAISAVAGDVTAPLRRDIEAGHANIDQELVLKAEAAGGFAAAHTAEEETKKLDEAMKKYKDWTERGDFNPGQAAMVQAKMSVDLMTQQSHIMRLLSREVRLESMHSALEYGARIRSRNAMYEQSDSMAKFADQALSPPPLVVFDESDLGGP
jgi:hypothetical protein